MLTKEQVIKELSKFDTLGEGRIVFKVLDYSENRFAPEKVAYRVHYSNYIKEQDG